MTLLRMAPARVAMCMTRMATRAGRRSRGGDMAGSILHERHIHDSADSEEEVILRRIREGKGRPRRQRGPSRVGEAEHDAMAAGTPAGRLLVALRTGVIRREREQARDAMRGVYVDGNDELEKQLRRRGEI